MVEFEKGSRILNTARINKGREKCQQVQDQMHIASKYFEFNSEIVVIFTFFEGNFELSWQ